MLRRPKEAPVVQAQHERISHSNPNNLLYESPLPGLLRFAHSQALLGNVVLQAGACLVSSQSGDWELARDSHNIIFILQLFNAFIVSNDKHDTSRNRLKT
jgi:hypothetical protein